MRAVGMIAMVAALMMVLGARAAPGGVPVCQTALCQFFFGRLDHNGDGAVAPVEVLLYFKGIREDIEQRLIDGLVVKHDINHEYVVPFRVLVLPSR